MKSLTVCLSSLLIFALIFSDTKVTAQQVLLGTIIVHPGQDVELFCNVTPSGSQTAAWIINHGVYTVQQLHNGILTGYSSNGNNLIIENIMMNDDRNDTEYSCVTVLSTVRNPTVADIVDESDPTILYVADNSGVVVAVVIVVVLLILVGCITMDILFCYCCKRRERYHQDNGEDKMSHYCIIVLGISTLGTSVLLWWLYKYFSGKDKYDVEAHSAVPLSSTKSSKDGHKDKDEDKDAYKRSVEYDTIAEATSIQGSPPAVSYAATTQVLSKDTNTGPALQYDYARTGPLKGKADTKNQRIPEYAVVDKSKKKKKMDDKQQKVEQDIRQPQMGGHKQETELNYMDPGNLEFSEEPHISAHKHETDQTVQYGNLVETPQYTNVM